MTEQNVELVRRGMLKRPVDSRRYRGLVREDKTLGWAVAALDTVEQMRGKPPEAWPTTTALPDALAKLADLLTELGWDDLAAATRREQVTAYGQLRVGRRGAFSEDIARALTALRGNLMDLERHEEALEVVVEQLRLPGTAESVQEALDWRTVLLARLGRHEEALDSAAEAIRRQRKRRGGASKALELSHAREAYAKQLDAVGRVAEAAEATAEVAAYWREHPDSTVKYLATVDQLSDRLVRSGRAEEAAARITEAIRVARHRQPQLESARIWHNFGVRLLELGLPGDAADAGRQAVTLLRERAQLAQASHRKTEEADDWDDDHRYAQWYLLERRREELESSLANVRRTERALGDALRSLSACLRRLNLVDEAAAADAEAAALARRPSEKEATDRD
ncbi:hypothetical protein [Streptomyces sp. NPDC097640]|uniref:hypothetical protein n=1 Tax=Streptomyces sp. NPDC097640 TaxID=3157229 RepID=UPI0033198620